MTASASSKPLCDLIMKGGITSGVIYPRLVAKLAEVYRFKNIGGSSAGAIGAAGAAAAEYGRSHGNVTSFAALDKLPAELGATAQGGTRSFLFHLFQPASALKDHFDVMVGALNAPGMPARIRSVATGLLCRFPGAALLGSLPGGIALLAIVMGFTGALWPLAVMRSIGALLVWSVALLLALGVYRLSGKRHAALAACSGLGVGILLAFLLVGGTTRDADPWYAVLAAAGTGLAAGAIVATALAAAALRFITTFGNALPRNHFGICTGMPSSTDPGHPLALTAWFHDYFNSLAGRPAGSAPLTFGDLWGCNDSAHPVDREAATLQPKLRAINLEVMTTAVSQGLPFRLPFKGNVANTFLFDPVEWQGLFPQPVFVLIMEKSRASSAVHPESGNLLRHLPAPADFPVVVAVRMSLSFPILLSAIPLYSVDWSLAENAGPTRRATRVWFSDGGISSNLPLHFFDARLPSHPTFAINLKPFHPNEVHDPGDPAHPAEVPGREQGRVYLPDGNAQGLALHWSAQRNDSGLAGIAGFLGAIVETMHNWRDEIQFPYPGYRDRIVRISQKSDEGGLNLDMPAAHIAALGEAGVNAAERLIARFAPGVSPAEGWTNHRAVRIRTFLGLMESLVLEVDAADKSAEHWRGLLANLPAYKFPDGSAQAHVRLGDDLLDAIAKAAAIVSSARSSGNVSLANGAPKPIPELRISPQL